ncbi:hypothetical protein ABFS83_07G080000 [Erythranthe nasuta]
MDSILEYKIQNQHVRRVQLDQTALNNITDGLSEGQITSSLKIKINSYPDIDDIRDPDEEIREVCAVCFDALCQQNNNHGIINNIRILEYKHEYHSDCIRRWLQVKNFCPLCKSVAFNLYGARRSC